MDAILAQLIPIPAAPSKTKIIPKDGELLGESASYSTNSPRCGAALKTWLEMGEIEFAGNGGKYQA